VETTTIFDVGGNSQRLWERKMKLDSNGLIIICMICVGVGTLVGFIAATFGFKRSIDKVKHEAQEKN